MRYNVANKNTDKVTCRSLKVKIKLYHFIFTNVNVCLLQRKNKMVYTTYVNISFDKRKIHLT